MNNDEFITIKDLNLNVNDKPDEPVFKIFQIQSSENLKGAYIKEVGYHEDGQKVNDVLINQYEFSNMKFLIVSSLFDIIQINYLANMSKIEMIKILINKVNDNKLNPFGYLSFDFNFNIPKDKNVNDYLSLIDSEHILLNGSFTITLYYNNKSIILEKLEEFPGNQEMITKCVSWTLDFDVMNILENSLCNI